MLQHGPHHGGDFLCRAGTHHRSRAAMVFLAPVFSVASHVGIDGQDMAGAYAFLQGRYQPGGFKEGAHGNRYPYGSTHKGQCEARHIGHEQQDDDHHHHEGHDGARDGP